MNKTQQQIVDDITEYITSGQTHSTLVGMQFTVGHKPDDEHKARQYAEYIVDLIKSAENYRRSNVKMGKTRAK